MKISKNKKMCFFLISQGSLNPKIRFLAQNLWSVARVHTDTHESEYRGPPFRVSGIFPSTYHQGPVQKSWNQSCRLTKQNTVYMNYVYRHVDIEHTKPNEICYTKHITFPIWCFHYSDHDVLYDRLTWIIWKLNTHWLNNTLT